MKLACEKTKETSAEEVCKMARRAQWDGLPACVAPGKKAPHRHCLLPQSFTTAYGKKTQASLEEDPSIPTTSGPSGHTPSSPRSVAVEAKERCGTG
jgi:hypothetical protein